MILRNDVGSGCLCPLQQILALAIADHALEGVETIEDLVVRDHMRDVPLLRHCSEANGVDPTKIWTYYYLHCLLKKLGKRAGHSDPLLPYSFRRGHGSMLDRECQFIHLAYPYRY